MMKYLLLIARNSLLLCLALVLTQCSDTRRVVWHYIVPDGYRGFLAIRYNCPGGQPLVETNGVITVAFNAQGIFCTSDDSFPSRGPLPTAQTRSGTPIPYVIEPLNYQGYAICCGNILTIGGNTQENPGADLVLGLAWVGDMHPRPRGSPEVPDDVNTFLQQRFGLRDVREQP